MRQDIGSRRAHAILRTLDCYKRRESGSDVIQEAKVSRNGFRVASESVDNRFMWPTPLHKFESKSKIKQTSGNQKPLHVDTLAGRALFNLNRSQQKTTGCTSTQDDAASLRGDSKLYAPSFISTDRRLSNGLLLKTPLMVGGLETLMPALKSLNTSVDLSVSDELDEKTVTAAMSLIRL